MTDEDIRWIQRFSNYQKALSKLREAVELDAQRELSELEKQGLIQAFEFTHELAWQVMRDIFIDQGNTEILGSRDATREAFAAELIKDGKGWMDMIKKRNLTSHTYNEETSKTIYDEIISTFFALFQEFEDTMLKLKEKQ
jgi:nucleotidyltransferase substrate binding protein (TIGR01987 family)